MTTTKTASNKKQANPPLFRNDIRTTSAELNQYMVRHATNLNRVTGRKFPQAALFVAYAIKQLLKVLTEYVEIFDTKVKEHAKKKGCTFEEGPVKIQFVPVSGRRTPPWKELCIARERTLHDLEGKTFSEKMFVDKILSETEPSAGGTRVVLELHV